MNNLSQLNITAICLLAVAGFMKVAIAQEDNGYSGYGQGYYGGYGLGYGGYSPGYGGYSPGSNVRSGGNSGATYNQRSNANGPANEPAYYGFGNGPYGAVGGAMPPDYYGYGMSSNGYYNSYNYFLGPPSWAPMNLYEMPQNRFHNLYGYGIPNLNNGFGNSGDAYYTRGSAYSRF
jgi:hypothetical protein